VRPSWDTSEARLNSFSVADERRLASLDVPIRMTAHLAPEDPRRSDLERNAVSKLRRTLKDFDIRYVSETSTGLFEQTREHYGEVEYRVGARTAVSRATTVEGVLNEIYALADIAREDSDYEEDVFRGRPLAATPKGAAAVFYIGWPALIAGLASIARGRSA
jgi:hypothetical protein